MSSECAELHRIFNSMERHRFPFDEKRIPRNGIYVLFEKGEKAHGADRIVRVGTHTGKNQLWSRLNQHFTAENKDRSIFRKNIGRCLLNMKNDPFLEKWEIDLTTREAREKFAGSIDFARQGQIEKEVTKYVQETFSFAAFQVYGKEERLDMESKIISTVSLCEECKPSQNWLGLFSTNEKVRESGLWNVNELHKEPLSAKGLEELKKILGK